MAVITKSPMNAVYHAPGVAVMQEFRKETRGRTIKRPSMRGSMAPSEYKSIVVAVEALPKTTSISIGKGGKTLVHVISKLKKHKSSAHVIAGDHSLGF